MHDPAAFLDALRARLAAAVPGLIIWQEREGARETRLIFPAAPDSDYRFSALVPDRLGRATLLAELVRDPEPRFWRHTVEADTPEALLERLAERLVPLLSGPSRIRQSRALLTWHFVCDVPGDVLGPLAGARRLRGVGRAPAVGGREAVYRAGPAQRRGGSGR